MSGQDTSFASLVSLACHDLRTPLATVSGFAKTLTRMGDVDDKVAGYLGMIDAAAGQLADLLEELALASRIEAGRWEPLLAEIDSLDLARDAVLPLGDAVGVEGTGTGVAVDLEVSRRSLYALARCAIRHGGLERVEVRVEGAALVIEPVTAETAPICLGRELRDFDAAVAVRAIAALGGATEHDDEVLRIRLPLAPVVG
jgi:signal transduction histidine kinase